VDNQFDNIEDSLRNAFDGFELPVSDMDWTAIENGLTTEPVKRGFIAWWNQNGKRNWYILGLLLLISVSTTWFLSRKDAPINGVNHTNTNYPKANKPAANKDLPSMPNTHKQQKGNQNQSSVSNNDSEAVLPKMGNTKNTKNATTKPIQAGIVANGVKPSASGKAEKIQPRISEPVVVINNPNPAAIPVTAVRYPLVPITVAINEPAFDINTLLLNTPFGIRYKPFNFPNLGKHPLDLKIPKTNLGWEWYAGLQTNIDKNKAKSKAGGAEWGGVQMPNIQHTQINVRFETGAGFRFRSTSVGAGFAFETGAYQTKSDDTIYIKIPTKLLPYITLQNDTMWLIQKTRDSMVVLHHLPNRQWIELPLYFTQRFAIGKNWSLTLGATLNPGYMVGSTGDFVNPYAFGNVGYSSPYQYGIDPKTLNTTGSASAFTKHFRFGNSIQAGIEKQMGIINFGLQLQTRYYYTPVYKNGVPLQQHTFNYGLNIRMGVKF